MVFALFLKGLIIGFAIAAPVGPIGVRESAVLSNSDKKLFHIYGKTFFLTLTNPMTILSFTAIFAGLGLGSTHTDYTQAILLISGIILGSASWWLILSSSVALILHHRVSSKILKIINKISGLIIFIFGIFALLK